MRRVCLELVRPGTVSLDDRQAHHVRDVLRLGPGDAVEVFDAMGRVAAARIVECDGRRVLLEVGMVRRQQQPGPRLVVASAIPRGARADWMVEKLSELGAARFVPLIAERSVVMPAGRSRTMRWRRLAEESARQCRRVGVMAIDEPAMLFDFLAGLDLSSAAAGSQGGNPPALRAWFLSADQPVEPAAEALGDENIGLLAEATLVVGPEGGFSPGELDAFARAGLTGLCLGRTILRTETAAVAAAAVFAAMLARRRREEVP